MGREGGSDEHSLSVYFGSLEQAGSTSYFEFDIVLT